MFSQPKPSIKALDKKTGKKFRARCAKNRLFQTFGAKLIFILKPGLSPRRNRRAPRRSKKFFLTNK
jgi:hypothetical protein